MSHQTHQTHQPGAGERRGASAQAERLRRGHPTTKREAGGGAQQPTTADARTRATASQASSLERGSLPLLSSGQGGFAPCRQTGVLMSQRYP